ncbi:hypothetical protein JB92DRAFT_2826790 [Gautieria morchelliformis]|nr:hypothetical protein JB92DRAFT_2826790 [Gautieria morchelliformis]
MSKGGILATFMLSQAFLMRGKGNICQLASGKDFVCQKDRNVSMRARHVAWFPILGRAQPPHTHLLQPPHESKSGSVARARAAEGTYHKSEGGSGLLGERAAEGTYCESKTLSARVKVECENESSRGTYSSNIISENRWGRTSASLDAVAHECDGLVVLYGGVGVDSYWYTAWSVWLGFMPVCMHGASQAVFVYAVAAERTYVIKAMGDEVDDHMELELNSQGKKRHSSTWTACRHPWRMTQTVDDHMESELNIAEEKKGHPVHARHVCGGGSWCQSGEKVGKHVVQCGEEVGKHVAQRGEEAGKCGKIGSLGLGLPPGGVGV